MWEREKTSYIPTREEMKIGLWRRSSQEKNKLWKERRRSNFSSVFSSVTTSMQVVSAPSKTAASQLMSVSFTSDCIGLSGAISDISIHNTVQVHNTPTELERLWTIEFVCTINLDETALLLNPYCRLVLCKLVAFYIAYNKNIHYVYIISFDNWVGSSAHHLHSQWFWLIWLN